MNPVVRGADEEQVILRFDRVHKRFVSRQGLFRPPRVLQAVRDVSFELRRGVTCTVACSRVAGSNTSPPSTNSPTCLSLSAGTSSHCT